MDLGVFYEVVVPLMEVKGTATIAISTPLGAWNFYSELTELRDANGKRVFNVKHIDSGKRPVVEARGDALEGQGDLRQQEDAARARDHGQDQRRGQYGVQQVRMSGGDRSG